MTRRNRRRPGVAAMLLVLFLPGLFLFVMLIVSLDRSRLTVAELRNAGTTAARAAAADLAADDLLTNDPVRVRGVIARARSSAVRLAGRNATGGAAVTLAPNANNAAAGDLVFGTQDRSFGGTFRPLNVADEASADWAAVNAVQVTVRQPGNGSRNTRVAAMFDTAVTGFRPTVARPAPMVPFALYDVPADAASWTRRLAQKTDRLGYDATSRTTTVGADGLFEVVVAVGTPPSGAVPTAVLNLGAQRPDDTLEQIGGGVTVANLTDPTFGGELSLDPDTMAKPVVGAANALNDKLSLVAAEFRKVVGQRRVWPRFSGHQAGQPIIVGFVAARLLKVEYAANDSAVLLTLQQAVLATPTALTQPSPPASGPAAPVQRSVGKVRLAG